MERNPLKKTFPRKQIKNKTFTVAYGAVWPKDIPDVHIELACAKNKRSKEDGGLGEIEHFKNTIFILFPEYKKTWNHWAERQLKGFLNKELMTLFLSGGGTGKAQPLDAIIKTPQGWTQMQNIKIGDTVCTPNGQTAKVIQLHPQGNKDIYKIHFSDNTSTEACLDHLWLTQTSKDRDKKRKGSLKTTKQILETLKRGNSNKNNHFIPITKPTKGINNTLPIEPYTLGAIIGDGSLNQRYPTLILGKEDIDIAAYIEKFSGLKLNPKFKPEKNCYNISLTEIKEKIKKLNLNTLSNKKIIPNEYLISNIQNRTKLLQGLLDTDGTISSQGAVEYSTTSKILAKQIKELSQSLGCTTKITSRIGQYTKNNKTIKTQTNYRVFIKIPNSLNPFLTKRKKNKFQQRTKYHPTRAITKIEFSHNSKTQCITLDSKEGLYLTNDYIVTHNSLNMAIFGLIWWLMNPAERAVIVCSTSLDSMGHRVFGYVLKEWKKIKELGGTKRKNAIYWKYYDDKTETWETDESVGIFAKAVKEGPPDRAIADLLGFHPTDGILAIWDELPDMNSGVTTIIPNWINGTKSLKIVGAGNPKEPGDTLYQLAEPIQGWSSIKFGHDKKWKTKYGEALHFDCYDSPAIVEPHREKDLYFFFTKEKIEQQKTLLGGANSPLFLRQVRGIYTENADSSTIITPAMAEKFKVYDPVTYAGFGTTTIAALDPSYGQGHDECILRFAKIGYNTNAKHILDFMGEPAIHSLHSNTADKEPIEYQIATQVIQLCNQYGVHPNNLAVDAWGTGSGIAAMISKYWSDAFLKIVPVGPPSDRFVDHTRVQKAIDIYDRKATELAFSMRYFIQAGQIKGLDKLSVMQLCNRRFDTKGKKIAIEQKDDFRKRNRTANFTKMGSPDRADTACIMLELARQRFEFDIEENLRQQNKEMFNDLRKYENKNLYKINYKQNPFEAETKITWGN